MVQGLGKMMVRSDEYNYFTYIHYTLVIYDRYG